MRKERQSRTHPSIWYSDSSTPQLSWKMRCGRDRGSSKRSMSCRKRTRRIRLLVRTCRRNTNWWTSIKLCGPAWNSAPSSSKRNQSSSLKKRPSSKGSEKRRRKVWLIIKKSNRMSFRRSIEIFVEDWAKHDVVIVIKILIYYICNFMLLDY